MLMVRYEESVDIVYILNLIILYSQLQVPMYLREATTFKLPTNVDITKENFIFIGPGTGVAPFRGFLQYIEHKKSKHTNGHKNGYCNGMNNGLSLRVKGLNAHPIFAKKIK